ncbi:hypothetical protein B0H11DRAFT_1926062 [Mycena galericulata]|nr:hypothetical protein B0H11DRAFT_1926062 [Mycena galericulata]
MNESLGANAEKWRRRNGVGDWGEEGVRRRHLEFPGQPTGETKTEYDEDAARRIAERVHARAIGLTCGAAPPQVGGRSCASAVWSPIRVAVSTVCIQRKWGAGGGGEDITSTGPNRSRERQRYEWRANGTKRGECEEMEIRRDKEMGKVGARGDWKVVRKRTERLQRERWDWRGAGTNTHTFGLANEAHKWCIVQLQRIISLVDLRSSQIAVVQKHT